MSSSSLLSPREAVSAVRLFLMVRKPLGEAAEGPGFENRFLQQFFGRKQAVQEFYLKRVFGRQERAGVHDFGGGPVTHQLAED